MPPSREQIDRFIPIIRLHAYIYIAYSRDLFVFLPFSPPSPLLTPYSPLVACQYIPRSCSFGVICESPVRLPRMSSLSQRWDGKFEKNSVIQMADIDERFKIERLPVIQNNVQVFLC